MVTGYSKLAVSKSQVKTTDSFLTVFYYVQDKKKRMTTKLKIPYDFALIAFSHRHTLKHSRVFKKSMVHTHLASTYAVKTVLRKCMVSMAPDDDFCQTLNTPGYYWLSPLGQKVK
jgi:hypothetical protein